MASATLNSEEALSTVKQVNDLVVDIAERANKLNDTVKRAYERTNMPYVNRIYDTTLKLADTMRSTKESCENVLAVMRKYAADVDELAEDMTGFNGL